MRKLSSVEKKLVDLLVSKPQSTIASLFITAVPDLLISKNNENHSCYLYISKVKYDDYTARGVEISLHLISVVSFLEMLQKDSFIYKGHLAHGRVYQGTMSDPTVFQDYQACRDEYVAFHFPDEEMKELIFKYWDKVVWPTFALKEYHRKKYRTIEEVQFDTNKRLTIAALILSTLLGFAGIYLSVIALFKEKNRTPEQVQAPMKKTGDATNRKL